jgi:ABC-type transporter MlaC component
VKIVLLGAVSLDETARFMLGQAWPTDNKQAALRFQEEFQEFVAEAVARGLRANPTLSLAVNGSRVRPDGSVLVLSTLNLPSGKTLPVDWQMARDPAKGTFRITDVAAVGIDAAILLRSVATTLLADGETDIGGLIPRLRAALLRRAAAQPSAAPPPAQ